MRIKPIHHEDGMAVVAAYLGAAVVMAGLDLTWLRLTADGLYHPSLGGLLAGKTNNAAAVAFYLVYVAGIVFFGTGPALRGASWATAFVHGALFGFFAYATYDLTNLATLKDWPLRLSLIDMAWGTFVTGAASAAGALAAGLVQPK